MKYIFIFFITVYQQIFSPLLKELFGMKAICRYNPSCSEYAKQAIRKYGIFKGGVLALNRFARCQPFAKSYVPL